MESLRLRFALLQSLNNTLESFFLPLVELRQTQTYQNSIAALLCEAKGEQNLGTDLDPDPGQGDKANHDCVSESDQIDQILCFTLASSASVSAGYRSDLLRH